MTAKRYTYNQVFEESLKYFEGDELAAKVFPDKYALQNNEGEYEELTPVDMHRRLSREFARIEAKYPNPMSEEEIFSLLDRFKYIVPQGSPMAGIGNPYQIMSISNCFVLESPHDSYAGIMHTDQEEAHIMRRRGGVGFDISKIRPRGLPTNNAAKTTDGIGIFMERFSNTCREVAQNGRRGALMLTISVHHPEIRTFINIKKDLKKVTGANISVRVTDEFMNAVKAGEKYQVRWPVESSDPSISEMIDAKEIWHELISAAHASAEPGILFWTTAEKYSPADIYKSFGFGSTSTNPCFSGDTLIAVADGRNAVSIKQLAEEGKDVPVYSVEPSTGKVSIKMGRHPRITGYDQKLVRVHLDDGSYLDTTPNHNFIDLDGNKIEAKDLTTGTSLPRFIKRTEAVKKGSKPYYLVHCDTKNYKKDRIFEHRLIAQFHEPQKWRQMYNDAKKNGWTKTGGIVALDIESVDADTRLVKTYQKALKQNYVARIEGSSVLVSRNCEQCGASYENDYFKREIAFCSHACSLKKINSNAEMHASRTAKTSATYEARSVELKQRQAKIWSGLKFQLKREPLLKEWEAACKTDGLSYRLKTKFGFKNLDELREAGNNYNHKVVRVEEIEGQHTVYNITVDDNHTLGVVTDVGKDKYTGVYVPQCGEIVLSPNDSCRLLLVNLMGFVDKPFTKKAKFNFEKYLDVVQKAQRLMDDIIDLEIECVDRILAKIDADPEPEHIKETERALWNKIKKACLEGRRTGLGITALGDCLAALGIKYGSDESITMTEEIYKHLAIGSYKSTCVLAGERGAFPIFSHDLEKDHPFLQRIWDAAPEVYELYKKFGRRNIALTTTAPAGSVSVLTQTTSGIEPPYLLSYVRRKKINPADKNSRVDFVDPMGDSWQEFTVYHPGVKRWMDVTGEIDLEKSPYWGATSNEIDWVASAKMQGVAQKWICHSISKTCNLPNETTVDVVKDVYMMAWEVGCKGFTVYRDGCRTGVLVSEETHKKQNRDPNARPEQIEYMMAPKRPQELPCEIRKAKIQGESWTLFIGMLQGKPYEVFGGLSKYVDISNKHKTGKIVKNGKVDGITSYNLILGEGDDQMVIKNIANVFENSNYGTFTRTISLALRHGAPVQYVVEQLQKDKFSDMTSFSKVMARVLKTYIKDGTKAASEKTCSSCGQDTIIYAEGCLKCTNCSYSKCG